MNASQKGNLSNTQSNNFAHVELSEGDDEISRLLVEARKNATPLDDFPGPLPETLTQAYAIQSASIERWPDDVAGWKVGMLSPENQKRYSAERLVGPIFGSQIHEISSGSRITMPVFAGGFAAIEAEFVFKLAQTIKAGDELSSDDDLLAAIAGLYVGAEIASSPMAEINNLGPTVVISDFGNNAGLVLGPEIPDWHSRLLTELPSSVIVDGERVGDASAAALPGGPFGALRFAVSVAAMRGIDLPAGSFISTGASTGIHDVLSSSSSRVEFGKFGWFDVNYEPMREV